MRTGIVLVCFGLLVLCQASALGAAPGEAAHGYLGVGLADAPAGGPGLAAVVGPLDPNGPAARAGLKRGDLIRAVNGKPVENGTALQTYVFTQRPGAVLVFDVMRRGPGGCTSVRVTATLATPAGSSPSPSPGTVSRQEVPSAPATKASAPTVKWDAPAPSNIRYVHWVDPAEKAFTTEVPAGWRVGGRLMRYDPLSIAPFVQAMTPDGTIFVQIGDWRIKDYSDLPGWRQGQVYTPGTSIFIIRRFESAEQYAQSYSSTFEKQLGCGNGSITGSQSMPIAGTATVPQSHLETHMVTFSCTRGGEHYAGRVMDTIQSYRAANSIGWNILYLACMLARDDRAPTGVAVWDKMRTAAAFDQNWLASQSQVSGAAIRPAMQSLDATLRETQAFDQNVINGTITVNDPTTGARSNINIGAQPFYFADGLGHFYNSYDPTPRSGFHSVNPVQ